MFSHPTAQYLYLAKTGILIDCGEGTQIQLRRAKVKFSSIKQIFISHLHGDHVLGLAGLLSSFSLLGRTIPIEIFGPKGIKDFIEFQLNITEVRKKFIIIFNELQSKNSELIFENSKYSVTTIPLSHRINTNGYLFKEKDKLRNLNLEEIKKHSEIQICDYNKIKNGEDIILSNGFVLNNKNLTFDTPQLKSYAYCSDTKYSESIIPIIEEVDVLYHESTFLYELEKLAIQTGHCTALEAATIAQKSKVKKLILGHFSNRYSNYHVFLNEAKSVFENTFLPQLLEKIEI